LNTNNKLNIKISIALILASFVAAHLLTWLLPGIFESWNSGAIDQLFLYRASSKHFRPYYDDTIVHVDLDNRSIQQFNQYYLDRTHHAQVISNLLKMKAAALLYDYLFAAPSNEAEDRALIRATSAADNVYFGMAFKLDRASKIEKKPLSLNMPNNTLKKNGR
jgi:CHASE2 domain-containing sensor protein